MNMVKYRSEEPYGEGYRDIIQVLYHEQYEFYLDFMIPPIQMANLYGNYDQRIKIIQEVVSIISNRTGIRLIYCLWLCNTPSDVNTYYGASKESIVSYNTGLLLVSLKDGSLYGWDKYGGTNANWPDIKLTTIISFISYFGLSGTTLFRNFNFKSLISLSFKFNLFFNLLFSSFNFFISILHYHHI